MAIRYTVKFDVFDKWAQVHNWCHRAFGPVGHGWWYCGYDMETQTYKFEFETVEMATQVKLTWL